jgi:hypothetical protein
MVRTPRHNKFNPMIGSDRELQAMAIYQFNNNINHVAVMLGAQETGQAERFHTD